MDGKYCASDLKGIGKHHNTTYFPPITSSPKTARSSNESNRPRRAVPMGKRVPLEEPHHICPAQYSVLLPTGSEDLSADNDIDTAPMQILSKTACLPQMLPMSPSRGPGSWTRHCQKETLTDSLVVRRRLNSGTFVHENAGIATRTLCRFVRKRNKRKESPAPANEVAADASHLKIVDGELGDGVRMFEINLAEEPHSGVSALAGDQNGVSFFTSCSKAQRVSFHTNDTPTWCSSAECMQSHPSNAVPSNVHTFQSMWKRLLRRRSLQSPPCTTAQLKNVQTSETFWSEDAKAFRRPKKPSWKSIAENDHLFLYADDKSCSTTAPALLCLDVNRGSSSLPPDDRISLIRFYSRKDGPTPYVEGETGHINGPSKKEISVDKIKSNAECLDHELITGCPSQKNTAGENFRELDDSAQYFFSPIYKDGKTRRDQQRQGHADLI